MADRLRFGGSVVKATSLKLTALGGGDESPVLFLNENGVQLLIKAISNSPPLGTSHFMRSKHLESSHRFGRSECNGTSR